MASTSTSTVRKPKCCSCNGVNARCKSCVCVKSNRSCMNCQPMKCGGCANSNRSAALSHSKNQESTTGACSQPSIVMSKLSAGPVTSFHNFATITYSITAATAATCFTTFATFAITAQITTSLETQHHESSSPTLATSSSVDVFAGTVVNKNFTRVFGKHRPVVSLPCPFSSCSEQVLPSMWKIHMDKHASGALSGKIPQEWLSLNHYTVCSNCCTLVSISHTHAHISHCSGNNSSISDINHAATTSTPDGTTEYPSFDDIFSTSLPTIKHISVYAH